MRGVVTLSATFALGLLQARTAFAWGAMAHQTVALVAQDFLTPTASKWVNSVLGSGATMASVANWADSFRGTKAGRFSAGFHFIDAEDSPPSSCGVEVARDCGPNGCVVTAIANYTARVQDQNLPKAEQTDALKFLVHFFGDITQPLHCEALDRGGNTVPVVFSGKKTNLHAAWDSAIPEAIAGGKTLAAAKSWSKTLIDDIKTGPFKSEAPSWIACNDISDAVKCALEWATDSNSFICSFVIKDGIDAVDGAELSGPYFDGAQPITALQVAKGGFRLANWLNAIAEAS